MEERITKKMRFEELKGILTELGKTELVQFVEHEIDLIDKKAQNRKKETSKRAIENQGISELILEALERVGKPVTITELLKDKALSEYVTEEGKVLSNQKVSAIIKPMLKSGVNPGGLIVRTTVKRITYFSLTE